MNKNLKQFGQSLKKLRMGQNMSLRDICKIVNYDASNWSKIERGIISPPSDVKVLDTWAHALGLSKSKKEYQEFVDEALIAQSIIPDDIMAHSGSVAYLPAFFRTIRGQKPTKEEIDQLMRLIKGV
jgi:transcriptional regulator with XRE-family HTH domain